MLRIEDAEDRAFTRTHLSDGYEIAEVDEFCSDVVEAITLRDEVIGQLQGQLVEARNHLADARAVQGPLDGNRRESTVASARLLEMAAVTADQLVADAKAEVDSLMTAAHAEAGQLITASRSETERVTAELAHDREQQAAELDQHRTTMLADVADRKAALEARIESLRQLDREHRSGLRRHFTEQLAQLDGDRSAVLRAVAAD